jgi:uncharacterized protein YlxW (UPF0749 family)
VADQQEGRRKLPASGAVGVAVVLALAGFLFATSALTSRGTQLRSERADLADAVAAQSQRVQQRQAEVAALHAQVDRVTADGSQDSAAVTQLERRSAELVGAAGLTPATGAGLEVTLDDAPREVALPAEAGPDDLVVHQQDVQAVVNALWAGGATAMQLQDQRVISTSAVRCVGNTLLLQGRVYSPPYTVRAVGDPVRLRAALDASPEVAYYLQYVASLRLGWQVTDHRDLTLPAYSGSLALTNARIPGSSS